MHAEEMACLLYTSYQDRDDQQVIAAYEVEAREVLRTRAAFDLYTEVDATAVLSDGRIGLRNVANISSFTTVPVSYTHLSTLA